MTKIFFILFSLLAFSSQCFAADALLGGKLKSHSPIAINSDELEVVQEEHKAIFTGNVVAVQDDTHLKSEKMTVYYKSDAELPAGKTPEKKVEKTPAKNSPLSPEKNSIEKIVVEKDVFMTTPDETASGDNGIYDVEHHKIYLNDNVVLTKDKNVIKGDRLVHDLDTGVSTMNEGKPTTPLPEGKKQRVKALFVPKDKKNNQ